MSKWYSVPVVLDIPENSVIWENIKISKSVDYKILFPNMNIPGRVKCKIRNYKLWTGVFSKIRVCIKCKDPDWAMILKMQYSPGNNINE